MVATAQLQHLIQASRKKFKVKILINLVAQELRVDLVEHISEADQKEVA
jgi:hypothetical protein